MDQLFNNILIAFISSAISSYGGYYFATRIENKKFKRRRLALLIGLINDLEDNISIYEANSFGNSEYLRSQMLRYWNASQAVTAAHLPCEAGEYSKWLSICLGRRGVAYNGDFVIKIGRDLLKSLQSNLQKAQSQMGKEYNL